MNLGGSQIQFTLGKGTKKDYILAGVLGVVIVASVVVALHFAMAGPEKGNVDNSVHFQCFKKACGNEFVVQPKQLTEEEQMLLSNGTVKIACTKCGDKSSYPQDLCPKCNKWFIPQRSYDANSSASICPTCKLDVVEYQRNEIMAKIKANQ